MGVPENIIKKKKKKKKDGVKKKKKLKKILNGVQEKNIHGTTRKITVFINLQ